MAAAKYYCRVAAPVALVAGIIIIIIALQLLPKTGLIGEFLTNFRTPKRTRKTVLNPPKPPPNGPKMVPKCGPRW